MALTVQERLDALTPTAREAVLIDAAQRQRAALDLTRSWTWYVEQALDDAERLRASVNGATAAVVELRTAVEAAGRLGENPSAADLAAAGLDVSMPHGREQVALAALMPDEEDDKLGVDPDEDRRPMRERSRPKETPGELAPEHKGCRRCGGSPEVHTRQLRNHAFVS